MKTLTFALPIPLNLANARLHWRDKNRRHQAWQLRAIVEEPALRGRHDPLDCVRVSAVFYIGSGSPMDDDNATARLKWALDLLVQRRIIVDDRRPHLTLAGIPEQLPGHPRRLVLTVEEVASPQLLAASSAA